MKNKTKDNKLYSLKWTKSWTLVFLSVIASFVAWLMIIDYENPVIEDTFYAVKIDYLASEDLNKRNLYAETTLDATVDITISGRRNTVIEQKAEDFSAEVDLSKVKYGQNNLPIKVKSNNKEIEIKQLSRTELEIDVDHLLSRVFSLELFADGKLEEPYYLFSASSKPASINIKGAQQKLDKISRVFALYPISDKKQSFFETSEIYIVDADGDFVEGIELSDEQAKIDVKIGTSKELKVEQNIAAFDDDDYRITDFNLSKDSVKLKGLVESLQNLRKVKTKEIVLAEQIGEQIVDVELDLPDSTELAAKTVIKAKAKVDRFETQQFEINASEIELKNLDSDFSAIIPVEELTVALRALSLDFDKNVNQAQFYIDLDGLDIGRHSLPIQLEALEGFQLASPYEIEVIIEE